MLNNFKWGQFSILITAGIWGAFLLYENGKRNLSAVLLGLMIAIKFYPAFFLLPFLFKRDWKYLLVSSATAAICLLLVPLPFLGFSEGLPSQFLPGERITWLLQSVAIHNIDTQYFPSVMARDSEHPHSFFYNRHSCCCRIFSLLVPSFLWLIEYLDLQFLAADSGFAPCYSPRSLSGFRQPGRITLFSSPVCRPWLSRNSPVQVRS